MIVKTIKSTVNVLVEISVWCAAVVFGMFIAMVTVHCLVMGGITVYSLMH
jgi:Na+-translocating ferredoxin:NAD+ oxidoreductase RnfE subunit